MTAILDLLDSPLGLFVLAATAIGAGLYALAAPMLERDKVKLRMKAVSTERQKIRERERARLDAEGGRAGIRRQPKSYMKRVVDKLNLREKLAGADMRTKLAQAGHRSDSAVVTFLFARVAAPLAFAILSTAYVTLIGVPGENPVLIGLAVIFVSAFIGFYAPNIYISNLTTKRQQSIRRAWPDALDLLRICVDSGMSVEAAFRKVSEEISMQSVELAEEMALTTAELAYLSDRKMAYQNMGDRTGVEGVKAVAAALIQSERYGTPVSTALRVLAQENRDMRMTAAEKKAAALPPKLTVPMMLFFLPGIFIIILGPAGIQVAEQFSGG